MPLSSGLAAVYPHAEVLNEYQALISRSTKWARLQQPKADLRLSSPDDPYPGFCMVDQLYRSKRPFPHGWVHLGVATGPFNDLPRCEYLASTSLCQGKHITNRGRSHVARTLVGVSQGGFLTRTPIDAPLYRREITLQVMVIPVWRGRGMVGLTDVGCASSHPCTSMTRCRITLTIIAWIPRLNAGTSHKPSGV